MIRSKGPRHLRWMPCVYRTRSYFRKPSRPNSSQPCNFGELLSAVVSAFFALVFFNDRVSFA